MSSKKSVVKNKGLRTQRLKKVEPSSLAPQPEPEPQRIYETEPSRPAGGQRISLSDSGNIAGYSGAGKGNIGTGILGPTREDRSALMTRVRAEAGARQGGIYSDKVERARARGEGLPMPPIAMGQEDLDRFGFNVPRPVNIPSARFSVPRFSRGADFDDAPDGDDRSGRRFIGNQIREGLDSGAFTFAKPFSQARTLGDSQFTAGAVSNTGLQRRSTLPPEPQPEPEPTLRRTRSNITGFREGFR
tara:strand:- start:712 stop:1446 length:735 start_codon:yes stop_codon:yes gene_type:complete